MRPGEMMDDLISRRAAITAIDDLPNCYNGYSDAYDKACIIGVLEELPTIEPKRGKWIRITYCDGSKGYKCTACGGTNIIPTSYCGNCGAIMDPA